MTFCLSKVGLQSQISKKDVSPHIYGLTRAVLCKGKEELDFPEFYTCEFSSAFLNRLFYMLRVVVHIFLLETNSSDVAKQGMSVPQLPRILLRVIALKFVVHV